MMCDASLISFEAIPTWALAALVAFQLLVAGWLINQYLKQAGGPAPPPSLSELLPALSDGGDDDGE